MSIRDAVFGILEYLERLHLGPSLGSGPDMPVAKILKEETD